MNEPRHIPVLLTEIMKIMPKVGLVVDATFGDGGYTHAILEQTKCRVLALDQDPTVLPRAEEFKKEFGERFSFRLANFNSLQDVVITPDAFVFDVGVSSMQIDTPERGFSYMHDGPLDMRMSLSGRSAYEIVNSFSKEEIHDIIKTYGEERSAAKIASVIERERFSQPIATTKNLVDVIHKAVGFYKGGPNYPVLSRVFQALRIYVNDELESLKNALVAASEKLLPGGILAVVSFHSLEDRIVKNYFDKLCGKVANPSRYAPDFISEQEEILFEKGIYGFICANEEEVNANPRSASAKLRYVVKVGGKLD